MESVLSLATKAMFVENMALAYFLGMCSFLAVSEGKDCRWSCFAVVFVLVVTCPLNNLVYNYLLRGRCLTGVEALANLDLSLNFLALIGTIAASVFEMVLALCQLSRGVGYLLPLIAVNCAILGASLFC